jgi:Domain of unknown function (DUF4276)
LILSLACIVEGHGDVKAVPVLLRRMAAHVDAALQLRISPPLRVPRYKLVKTGEIERSVDLAARKTGGQGGVLVLIDGEDECPAQLGPDLLRRARVARSDVSIAVVLAKYEYEAWFLASAESLRGKRGLADDLSPPADPESIRDAKGWLSDRMTSGRNYRETLDQPALTAEMDFAKARSTGSFDKCFREVLQLLNDLRQHAQGN